MRIPVTGPRGFVGARIMQALGAVPVSPLRNAIEDDVRRLVEEVALAFSGTAHLLLIR